MNTLQADSPAINVEELIEHAKNEVECYTGWRWSAEQAVLVGGHDDVLYYHSKRCLDTILAIIGLITLLPLMLLIALAIKLDTPGPVFFRQKRIGAKRNFVDRQVVWEVKMFPVLKFRSMARNADEALHQAHI